MTNSNRTRDCYASLIFRGKDLNPRDLSRELGVTPTRSFQKGDIRGQGDKKWPHGFWELETPNDLKFGDLSDHLSWLLNLIYPRRLQIMEYLDKTFGKVDVEISCYLYLVKSNTSVLLNPQLLRQIADMGIATIVDIYKD
ncbi:MAG: DUF4279 domain-containing protein [Chloroflexi bacterium]|nr:DUF4279 domain-containing protein [Chloroflexota bacterium]